MDGLVTVPIQTIAKPTTSSIDSEIRVKNADYIGSYNWVEASTPTIMVPGQYNVLAKEVLAD